MQNAAGAITAQLQYSIKAYSDTFLDFRLKVDSSCLQYESNSINSLVDSM